MVRKHGFAALFVAAALLSGANAARAQGSVVTPPVTMGGDPPAQPVAAPGVAPVGISSTHIQAAVGVSALTPPASSAAVKAVAGAPGAPAATAVEPLFSPPAVLDRAWRRVMRAVVAGVKSLVDAEQIEASEALAPSAAEADTTSHAPTLPIFPTPVLQTVPPARAAWSTERVVRQALATSAVQLTPIPIEPPTEVGVDTRGEHAVLLGVRMELPWMVP
jgi:hypothetical protein